jgi:hypothetical protein
MPGGKKYLFVKCQEACRKDVERAFGVLLIRCCLVPYTYMVKKSNVGDHECMCYHAQHDH